ncbi:hypothetical protein [Sinomicrobium soli]|uniref:hypothetical protein n=1 Tax=Sinomicrobium sp. N-1-3-6 TaxID=2219864 RepID=UPI000DCD5DAC|nr:hypothetical protein [Sinomicrobium sp. N-1-3-6]RAV28028.1 hypothetical protein DN748_15910 [Sinomicrobium sp. N-1-3-6]
MKVIYPLGLLLILVTGISCSGDDDANISELTFSGTVLKQLTCTGPVYQIKVENYTPIDTLTTPTLPGSYQEEGLHINFRVTESGSTSACAAIYAFKHVYDIYDVRLKPTQNE